MGRSQIPNALQMRALKYEEASEAERDRVAEALRAAGRRAEAILLFDGRGDHPFLREEARWAVSEGDSFLLLSIRRLGREVTPEELAECARAAEQRGRWMDARSCYAALGDEAALRRIAEHLPASLQPATDADTDTDTDT